MVKYVTGMWGDHLFLVFELVKVTFAKDFIKVTTLLGRTVSLTNFSWRDELYDLLSRMGAGESPCDEERGSKGQEDQVEIFR